MKGSEILREILKDVNLNANEFAAKLELQRSQNVYDILNDKTGISKAMAALIQQVYPEYSTEWLLTGNGDKYTAKHSSHLVIVKSLKDFTELKGWSVSYLEKLVSLAPGTLQDIFDGKILLSEEIIKQVVAKIGKDMVVEGYMILDPSAFGYWAIIRSTDQYKQEMRDFHLQQLEEAANKLQGEDEGRKSLEKKEDPNKSEATDIFFTTKESRLREIETNLDAISRRQHFHFVMLDVKLDEILRNQARQLGIEDVETYLKNVNKQGISRHSDDLNKGIGGA